MTTNKVKKCYDHLSGVQPPASSDAHVVNVKPVNQELDVFRWLRLGDYADVRNIPGVHLPDQKGKLTASRFLTFDIFKWSYHKK